MRPPSSLTTSVRLRSTDPFFATITMSVGAGSTCLWRRKNSRRSLLTLFLCVAFPIEEPAAIPRRLRPVGLGRAITTKWGVDTRVPAVLRALKSSGLTSRSSLLNVHLSIRQSRAVAGPFFADGDSEAISPLCPPSLEDPLSGLCGHPLKKPMGSQSPPVMGLKRALHLLFLLTDYASFVNPMVALQEKGGVVYDGWE